MFEDKTVREPVKPALLLVVLAEALETRGFDGLYRPGICACRLDDLSPDSCMAESCSPGVTLENATCDHCTAEHPCAFHIGAPSKKETP